MPQKYLPNLPPRPRGDGLPLESWDPGLPWDFFAPRSACPGVGQNGNRWTKAQASRLRLRVFVAQMPQGDAPVFFFRDDRRRLRSGDCQQGQISSREILLESGRTPDLEQPVFGALRQKLPGSRFGLCGGLSSQRYPREPLAPLFTLHGNSGLVEAIALSGVTNRVLAVVENLGVRVALS